MAVYYANWTFDHAVTSDGVASPELKVGLLSPTTTVQNGAFAVKCGYSGPVLGQAWSIASTPTHILAAPVIQVPQSGTVT
jgi:hypothetical protein